MTYMNAELELVKFAAEDVLATSNDDEEVVTTTKDPSGEYVGEEDFFDPQ